jgi:type IV secretory pathway TrbD component
MKNGSMRKMAFFSGIVFVVLGLVILIFAEGARRWYSGIFFEMIGGVTLFASRIERTKQGS